METEKTMAEIFPQSPPVPDKDQSDQKRGIILVAEDDSFLRKLLCEKLKHEGFEFFAVTNGQEALDFLKNNKPMLMLLDLMMPTVDGFQVLESIRQEERMKDLPVIILSNVADKHLVERIQKLGADDYLVKAHFVLEEIMERINSVLKKRYI
jgi:DNA-binding response OmpR family regulator